MEEINNETCEINHEDENIQEISKNKLEENIQSLEEKVNKIIDNEETSLIEKSKLLNTIKKYIVKEQEQINLLINRISEIEPTKSKKYKLNSIEDLTNLFEEEENINSKIKIYQNICYKIDKFKSKLFDD